MKESLQSLIGIKDSCLVIKIEIVNVKRQGIDSLPFLYFIRFAFEVYISNLTFLFTKAFVCDTIMLL